MMMILRVAMMFLRMAMMVLRGGNYYINGWWNILRSNDRLLLILMDIHNGVSDWYNVLESTGMEFFF
jgi:hypothetical protein